MDMGFLGRFMCFERLHKGALMILTGTWCILPVRNFITEPTDGLLLLQPQFVQEGFIDIQNPVVGSNNQNVFLNKLIDENIIHGPVSVVFPYFFSHCNFFKGSYQGQFQGIIADGFCDKIGGFKF